MGLLFNMSEFASDNFWASILTGGGILLFIVWILLSSTGFLSLGSIVFNVVANNTTSTLSSRRFAIFTFILYQNSLVQSFGRQVESRILSLF